MQNKNHSPAVILTKLFLSIASAGCIFLITMPVLAADFIGVYLIGISAILIFALLNISTRAGLMMLVVSICAAVALIAGVFGTSSAMIHADRYRDLLGKETSGNFADVLPPIDIEQAPLVSKDMALMAMQKRLSDVSTLGSQVSVGDEPVKQIVDGKLVWVSFLQHRSLFKWFNAGSTPGYVVVSAHDPSDVRLVTDIAGKKIQLKYLPSAYFADDLERHVYYSGVMNNGLTDFLAEIDDAGRPYYVATRYKHSIGFSGNEADGAVVIDAQTGDVKVYALSSIPEWIDRIQPSSFVQDQMSDRGKLIHGYFNPSDQDRMAVDGDLDLVYGSDKRSYWVGGMASVGRNSGVSGFFFVDTRSKKLIWYKVPSVSQSTAASAAEKVNPEKHYTSTTPLPFLVANRPTYVMALKDDLGIARSYGMVDMRDNQIVAVGDTLNATLRVYQSKRSSDKVNADLSSTTKETLIDGVVIRVANEFRNGQTSFFVTIKHEDVVLGNIFTGTSDLSEELVLTQPGDRVVIAYGDGTTRVVSMSKFRNLEIPGREGVPPPPPPVPADGAASAVVPEASTDVDAAKVSGDPNATATTVSVGAPLVTPQEPPPVEAAPGAASQVRTPIFGTKKFN